MVFEDGAEEMLSSTRRVSSSEVCGRAARSESDAERDSSCVSVAGTSVSL
jgi:hypothetical protein